MFNKYNLLSQKSCWEQVGPFQGETEATGVRELEKKDGKRESMYPTRIVHIFFPPLRVPSLFKHLVLRKDFSKGNLFFFLFSFSFSVLTFQEGVKLESRVSPPLLARGE